MSPNPNWRRRTLGEIKGEDKSPALTMLVQSTVSSFQEQMLTRKEQDKIGHIIVRQLYKNWQAFVWRYTWSTKSDIDRSSLD